MDRNFLSMEAGSVTREDLGTFVKKGSPGLYTEGPGALGAGMGKDSGMGVRGK